MKYDALYGRQSIEKKDSISVESQLEYCRYETHGSPYIEYTDRGFSGRNTNRPDFERMMQDIRKGKIKRVIVYKLDRISRSIVDFANMMETFQKYQVEFVSSTEKFDTSTPIGRAMLNICIVFAQLERETIQKRVSDAYLARSKRGFYMGGRIPYGYRLTETVIDHIRTSMYEEIPEESAQLKLIYSLYADPANSLGDIVRYLNEHGIRQLRGGTWNSARLSDMLKNPVYVKADLDVYHFFKKQGAVLCSPASDFTGNHACYLYQGRGSTTRKQCDLTDKVIVLAPHKGLIPSKTWLACRRRCLNNRQSIQTCKSKNSWLAGKVKCGNCGYALVVKRAKTKWGRYFICSQTGGCGSCPGTGCTIYADVLEQHLFHAIGEKLSQFEMLSDEKDALPVPEAGKKSLRLAQIEDEIDNLIEKVGSADSALMKYINNRVGKLDAERQTLEEELKLLLVDAETEKKAGQITDHVRRWEHSSFEDKQAVADILIKVIKVADGKVEIVWRI